MRYATWCASLLGIALFLSAAPANAQATRTWVSGVGNDANPCSRTAPCKTFAGAISKTAPGGSINCTDPGGFGAVTITKAITIKCGGLEAGVLVSGTNGIVIQAGASDTVFLSGLDIDGDGTGLNGIKFNSGAALYVNNCVIRNFNAAAPDGNGIRVANTTGTAKLFVADTTIYNNTNATTVGAGISIAPSGSGGAQATISRTRVANNGRGIVSDSSGTSGALNVAIVDSVSAGNTNAGIVASAGPVTRVMVSRTASVNNGVGLNATGGNANILVGDSTITGNTTGVVGSVVNSYKNNQINNNASDGTPVTQVPGGFQPNGLQ